MINNKNNLIKFCSTTAAVLVLQFTLPATVLADDAYTIKNGELQLKMVSYSDLQVIVNGFMLAHLLHPMT